MKSILTLLFIVLSAPIVFAQDVANAILGTWKTEKETGHIEIYKTTSGHYAGRFMVERANR